MPDNATRVVVIPIGIAQYEEPSAAARQKGRQRFANLQTVDSDMTRVRALFAGEAFRQAEFQILDTITGSAGHISDTLTRVAQDLAAQGARTVILLWSGHGEAPGSVTMMTSNFFKVLGTYPIDVH